MGAKYGVCKECGRKGNLDSTGRCYRAECKAQRGKMPGQEETPATPGDAGETGAVSDRDLAGAQNVENGHSTQVHEAGIIEGSSEETSDLTRAQPFDFFEGLPARQVEPETAGASPEDGAQAPNISARATFPERSYTEIREATEKAIAKSEADGLPEDLDRPFTAAGIDFEPARGLRVVGKQLISIRRKHLSFLTGAVERHKLRNYTHARLAASKDGQAVAIKFYNHQRSGAHRLTGKHGGLTMSAAAFLRDHPGMQFRQGSLAETEWEGLFVVRLEDGEAA